MAATAIAEEPADVLQAEDTIALSTSLASSRPTPDELQQLSRDQLEQLCLRQCDVIDANAERIQAMQHKLVEQRCKAKAAACQAAESSKLVEKLKKCQGRCLSCDEERQTKRWAWWTLIHSSFLFDWSASLLDIDLGCRFWVSGDV